MMRLNDIEVLEGPQRTDDFTLSAGLPVPANGSQRRKSLRFRQSALDVNSETLPMGNEPQNAALPETWTA